METKVYSAKLENLHEMLEYIKAYCCMRQVEPRVLEQIILAAEEALVNIISYGYPNQEGYIHLTCSNAHPKGLILTIRDRGIPFNPLENVPSVLPPVNRLLEKSDDSLGGYGIYILTGLMDKVDYQRMNDDNILTLTKFF